MIKNLMSRGAILLAALALTACPSGKKCATNADCTTGQTCNTQSGTCQTGGTGGGLGGGTGGGITGGGTGGGNTGGGGTTGGGTGGGGFNNDGGMVAGGETCEMATVITPGHYDVTTVGKTNNYDVGCLTGSNDSAGPDGVYSVNVPAGQRLEVAVAPTAASNLYDPAVYLIQAPASNCNAMSADGGSDVMCLAYGDTGFAGTGEKASWTNNTGAAVDVFVVVDSYYDMDRVGSDGGVTATASGAATLDVALAQPAMDDSCDGTPTTLTVGGTLTAQEITTYGDDYASASSCDYVDGPDRVYQVTVPAGQVVSITATPEGSSTLDLTLNLVDGAGACGNACVASVDRGFDTDPETLQFKNSTGAAQTYLLVVENWPSDSNGDPTTGTFSLTATTMMTQPDDACQGATMLTAATPLTNQTTVGYFSDYNTGTGCQSGTLGRDRVYEVNVPAGQRGTVTVTGTTTPDGGSFQPSLSLVVGPAANCDAMPRVCDASSASASGAHSAAWFNGGASAQQVFAIVDSFSTDQGNFNISFAAATPPADDTCTSTTTTLAAGTRNDNLTNFASDYGAAGTGCYAFTGADRLYKVTVPAGQKYTATVTPANGSMDGGYDPVINFVQGPAAACEMTHTCVGGADFGVRGEGESAAWSNFTGAPVDLFVQVSDYTTSAATDYALVSAFSTPAAGESCNLPQTVTAGTFAAQSNVGLSPDVTFDPAAMGCVDTSGLPDRVYAVSVGANQTLTVTTTPPAGADGGVGTQNVAINIIDASSCSMVTTCADSANVGAGGAAETATFMNAGTTAKTVFVQVVSVPAGNFNVTVQLQ